MAEIFLVQVSFVSSAWKNEQTNFSSIFGQNSVFIHRGWGTDDEDDIDNNSDDGVNDDNSSNGKDNVSNDNVDVHNDNDSDDNSNGNVHNDENDNDD